MIEHPLVEVLERKRVAATRAAVLRIRMELTPKNLSHSGNSSVSLAYSGLSNSKFWLSRINCSRALPLVTLEAASCLSSDGHSGLRCCMDCLFRLQCRIASDLNCASVSHGSAYTHLESQSAAVGQARGVLFGTSFRPCPYPVIRADISQSFPATELAPKGVPKGIRVFSFRIDPEACSWAFDTLQ